MKHTATEAEKMAVLDAVFAAKWDYADRAWCDALVESARVNPDLANQPWERICPDAREKILRAYKTEESHAG